MMEESDNFQQIHDANIARDKLRPEIQETIMGEVETELLAYLENIKLKLGGKEKKEKKQKKPKKPRVPKPPKCCDGEKYYKKVVFCFLLLLQVALLTHLYRCAQEPTPMPEMISLLVQMNILQDLCKPLKTIPEFVGDLNYLGTVYNASRVQLDPSMQQLRQAITEYCILPQGSKFVKEHSPLINAVLLYGPSGCGKTHLVRAIANHTVTP